MSFCFPAPCLLSLCLLPASHIACLLVDPGRNFVACLRRRAQRGMAVEQAARLMMWRSRVPGRPQQLRKWRQRAVQQAWQQRALPGRAAAAGLLSRQRR